MGRGISKLKCGITEFKIVYTYFYDSLGKSLWPINPTSGILIFSNTILNSPRVVTDFKPVFL